MGIITHTLLRDTAVDFTYPYFFNTLGFIAKKPMPLSKLTAIVWPYQKDVWIAVLVSVPLFILTFWTFSKLCGDELKEYSDLGKVIQEVFQVLVMQGTDTSHYS